MVVFEDGLARKSEYRRFIVTRRRPTTCPRIVARCCAAGSPATWTARVETGEAEPQRRASPRPAARHRPDDRPAAQVRLPAAAGRRRRRRAAGQRGRRGAAPTSASPTSRVCGLAKRLEEVWLPDERVPGHPAPHLRGALPAAAGPRRGAPLRDHLPPAAPLEADDRLHAGRRAGPRRDPAQGAAARSSARSSGWAARASRRSPRCPASAAVPPRRSSPPSPSRPPPRSRPTRPASSVPDAPWAKGRSGLSDTDTVGNSAR